MTRAPRDRKYWHALGDVLLSPKNPVPMINLSYGRWEEGGDTIRGELQVDDTKYALL